MQENTRKILENTLWDEDKNCIKPNGNCWQVSNDDIEFASNGSWGMKVTECEVSTNWISVGQNWKMSSEKKTVTAKFFF